MMRLNVKRDNAECGEKFWQTHTFKLMQQKTRRDQQNMVKRARHCATVSNVFLLWFCVRVYVKLIKKCVYTFELRIQLRTISM